MDLVVAIFIGTCIIDPIEDMEKYMSQIKLVNGKYQALVNGKIVKRTKLAHLEYVLRKNGSSEPTVTSPVESRFSINERFGFIQDMVSMVCKGDQASVIVSGPGGLGKSHTVTKALQANGLKDCTLVEEPIGARASKKAYRVVKGHATPLGLYRTLYENKDGVLVFDDCDSVLKDPLSLNLLKGALDSYSKRIISWKSDRMDEDLPQVFEFKGRVVFISNLPVNALDQAIVTRSMAVDVSMTAKQKVERMRTIVAEPDFMPEYTMDQKSDALDLIDVLCDRVKELSLRTLIQVTKIRKSAGDNWKNLAEYAICG